MARRTITVADLFEDVDIDIFGTVFALRSPTRSSEEKSTAKDQEINAAIAEVEKKGLSEAEARKVLVPLYLDQLDLLLEPAEDEKGKAVHAKAIVKKLYDSDKIGLATINVLVAEIGNVRNEERRPT